MGFINKISKEEYIEEGILNENELPVLDDESTEPVIERQSVEITEALESYERSVKIVSALENISLTANANVYKGARYIALQSLGLEHLQEFKSISLEEDDSPKPVEKEEGFFKKLWNGIKKFFKAIWNKITEFFKTIWGWITRRAVSKKQKLVSAKKIIGEVFDKRFDSPFFKDLRNVAINNIPVIMTLDFEQRITAIQQLTDFEQLSKNYKDKYNLDMKAMAYTIETMIPSIDFVTSYQKLYYTIHQFEDLPDYSIVNTKYIKELLERVQEQNKKLIDALKDPLKDNLYVNFYRLLIQAKTGFQIDFDDVVPINAVREEGDTGVSESISKLRTFVPPRLLKDCNIIYTNSTKFISPKFVDEQIQEVLKDPKKMEELIDDVIFFDGRIKQLEKLSSTSIKHAQESTDSVIKWLEGYSNDIIKAKSLGGLEALAKIDKELYEDAKKAGITDCDEYLDRIKRIATFARGCCSTIAKVNMAYGQFWVLFNNYAKALTEWAVKFSDNIKLMMGIFSRIFNEIKE